MLKIRKSKVKVVSAITFLSLLSISYIGLSFYSIPGKVNAAEDFTEWRDLTNITYMQEMTIDICNKSKVGDRKALIDNRGGGYDNQGRKNSYVVQKLSDGNCWMVQNLKLTGEDAIAEIKTNVLDDSNTNLTKGRTFTLDGTLESIDEESNRNQFGIDFDYNNGPQVFSPDDNYKGRQKGYGAYYNWFAATAGTGNASVTTDGQDVSDSICPKGWRMPTAHKTNTGAPEYQYSFDKLVVDPLTGTTLAGDKYTEETWTTTYRNGILSLDNASGAVFSDGFFSAAGAINNGSLGAVGTSGWYWSSTAFNGGSTYNLSFWKDKVSLSSNMVRCYGYSVRCVANPAIKSSDLTDTTFGNIDANVNVQVGPTITIDAATGMSGQVDYTKILEGNISATISSNLNYDVMLSATQPALTKSDDATKTIPPVTAVAPLQKGVSGWGIWTGEGNTIETRTYEPINNSPQPYYNTSTPAADGIGTIHTFGVGIAVSPSIPNGTYSTVVTVTAANS